MAIIVVTGERQGQIWNQLTFFSQNFHQLERLGDQRTKTICSSFSKMQWSFFRNHFMCFSWPWAGLHQTERLVDQRTKMHHRWFKDNTTKWWETLGWEGCPWTYEHEIKCTVYHSLIQQFESFSVFIRLETVLSLIALLGLFWNLCKAPWKPLFEVHAGIDTFD